MSNEKMTKEEKEKLNKKIQDKANEIAKKFANMSQSEKEELVARIKEENKAQFDTLSYNNNYNERLVYFVA